MHSISVWSDNVIYSSNCSWIGDEGATISDARHFTNNKGADSKQKESSKHEHVKENEPSTKELAKIRGTQFCVTVVELCDGFSLI